MKTAELIGKDLDLMVGIAQGWKTYPNDSKEHGTVFHMDPDRAPFGKICDVDSYHPSTDWRQCGPLIEEYGIEFKWVSDATIEAHSYLLASSTAYAVESHMVAACRLIVTAKLGETVELPAYD